jgi:hypothetical protein
MRTRLFLSSNKYLSPELGWFSDKRPGNRQTAFLTIVAELVRCSPLDSGVRSGSSSDRLVAHLPDRGQATLTAGTSAAIVGPSQDRLPGAVWPAWLAPVGSWAGGGQARRRRVWGQAKAPDVHRSLRA